MREHILIVSAIIVAIIVAASIIVYIIPSSSWLRSDKLVNTISESREVKPLNISLISDEQVKILRPYKYYVLNNGSTIMVKDHNPFPFKIGLGEINDTSKHSMLPIYRIKYPEKPGEVIKIIKALLNINASSLKYDELTKTFIYVDTGHGIRFEYHAGGMLKGFFRIVFEQPRTINDESFIKRVETLTDNKLTYKPLSKTPLLNITLIPTTKHSKSESMIREYSLAYIGYLNDLPTPLGVLFKYNRDGKVVEIEGTLPAEIETLSQHSLIPVKQVCKLLSERVSGKVKANDWYISEIGFTELNITSIRLEYYRTLTQEPLLVPVYYFTGKWILSYNSIRDQGELQGYIIAISSK